MRTLPSISKVSSYLLVSLSVLFSYLFTGTATAQCSINASTSALPFTLSGSSSYSHSVAFNPQLNVYYVSSGGYIRTFSSAGAYLNQYYSSDVYSIWWNSNLNQLEGKTFGTMNAIRAFSLNSLGYPTSSNVVLQSTTIAPSSSYSAAYDDVQNELIYAYGTTIYRYSRATGALIGTNVISGMPSSFSLTNYAVMYTGCSGKEIALYDRSNRRVLFVDKSTYTYAGASQLPSNSAAPFNYSIAYANDRFWLANGTLWNSYDVLSFGLQTSNIPGPYCDGSTVSINFSLNSTTYNSGNVFTAQLSDASGSFTNPVTLGSVTSTTAQTITGTIPTNTPYGAGYRIRVVSSNPIRIGTDNGTGININVPNVNLGADFSLCPGDTTTLTAPVGALSYTWSTGANTQSITVTSAGSYQVTVSNGICSKADTIIASALTAPSPTLSDTVSTCASSVTLNPGSFTSYEWSTGATSATLSVSNSGTYSVTVTGSNTCEEEDEIFVNLLDAGILGDVDTSICAGDSVQLTSSGCYFQLSNITNTGVVNVNSQLSAGDDHGGIAVTPDYVYYVGNSYTARYTADLSSFTTYSLRDGIFSDLSNGQLYSFWNTNYSYFNSSSSVTTNINAIRIMDASLNYGSTITLSQSINAGFYSAIFAGSGFVVLYAGNDQHFYKIELPSGTVTDLGSYNLYNISYNSESWASWGIAECNGIGHSFLLRTNTNISAGTVNGAIMRFDLDSQSFSVASSFSSLNLSSMACITYSPWHSRWYYQAEYSNSLGIYNENLGYANATHNGNGAVNTINSFAWSTGATSPTITVSPTVTTSYSVTVSHQSASCSDTIQVSVNSLPSISLTDTVLQCNVDSAQLDAGSGFSSYLWSTGETTRQIQAKSSVNYSVSVTNSLGCEAVDSTLVELLDARIEPGDTTICSTDSVLIGVGSCGVEVNSLSLSNATGANLDYAGTPPLSFDDNSGIAATQTHVIVSGDYTTMKYSNDLSSVESFGFTRQGIFSDLNTGELYSFWNTNYTDFTNNFSLLSGINAIRRVNESNLVYGQTITLSQTINASSSTRIVAAGGGYVLLYAYPTLYKISLPDGEVEVLSTNLYLSRYNSEGWAAYGIAECNEDSYNLVYRHGGYFGGTNYPIVRFNLSNSTTSVVQSSASGFGDAANITVSPWANKWYFNTEASVIHFGVIGFEVLVSFDAQVENSFNSSYGGADVLWSTTDTASSIFVSPTSATDYSVAVTSNLQTCRDTISVSINASPIVSDSSTSLSCFGDTTGYIGVSVSGGVTPYSYEWSSGDTVATISNVTGGTYIYSVTGDNGCVVSDTLVVQEPQEIVVNSTILEETDCSNSTDGKAEISATGGTGALTYTWPSGSNDTIDSNLVTGLNIITISDASGCLVYDSITINANAQLVNPGPITSTSTFLCPGGTTSLFASNADSGVVAYKRVSDTMRTVNAYNTISISMSNLPPIQTGNPMLVMHYKGDLDAYNEYLNIRDENNQYIGRNYTTTTCGVWQSDTIFLTQTQVSNWLSDGQATFNILPYYAYYVNGCTYDYEIALELIYNSDIVKTYWFDTPTTDTSLAIGTGSSALVTANATTTTFYAATFGGGCNSAFDSITILVPPKPVSTYTLNPTSLCAGDTTQVTASGAVSYTWPSDPTISGSGTSVMVSPLTTTNYLVTVSDFFGCSHVDTMTINVNATPEANLLAVTPVSCQSNNDGTAAVFGTGGSAPYSYAWPDGSSSALKFALAQGAYLVTITDNNQCSDTITVNVDGPTPIDFGAVVSDISCNGQQDGSISLTPSGGVAPYTYNWSNGSTSTSLSSLSAGSYSVTVTDASNCSNDTSFTIIEPLPIVASITNSSDESCTGSANGSITAGVTGGTAPFTYAWSNGGSGMILTGLTGGTYTVSVTDAGGCMSTSSGTIATQPTSIVIGFNNVLDATCFGESTGAATAMATGGNAPYSYSWSNGTNVTSLNGVVAGTYTVVATDAVGCQANNTVTINQPTAIVSSVTGISDVTCAGGVNGEATINVSGGVAPYTYSWDNGGISATNTLLMAGTNTVIVADANGCADTVDVQINEPSAISLSANVAPMSCNGANDAEVSVTVSGGTTPYTHTWNTGATTNTISGLSGANYTVTITDNNGCVKDSTFIIVEPAALSVSITDSSNITCFGETDGWAVVEGTGGSLPYSYNWTNGSTNDTLIGVVAGTYSVTITDAGGCTSSATVQLTEPSTPFSIAISSSIDVTCFGAATGQATVAATGGIAPITYMWSNGTTTNAITSVTAGTYTVTATDASGCERTTTVDILEPTEIMVQTTSAQDETCASAGDGSITVSATGGTAGYTYNWSNGGTTATISNLSIGGYTVTVTDANGCQVTLDTAVSAPAPIVVTVDSLFDAYCHGASDGYISTSTSGGTMPYSYAWSTGETTNDAIGLAAGTYTITVTDANGCSVTSSSTVAEPVELIASTTVEVDNVCNAATSGIGIVSATGGTMPYSYNWPTSSTVAHDSNLAAGSYIVTITDANGCSDTTLVTITEPSALAVSMLLNTPVSCNGLSDGSYTVGVSGGTTPYTYAWSNGDTDSILNSVAAGSYTLTVTDGAGCTETYTATVTEPTAIVISGTITNISCNSASDGSININTSGGTSGYSYAWSNGASSSVLTGLAAGAYTVTVTDANSCTEIDTFTIAEPLILEANATVDSIIYCFGYNSGGVSANPTGGTAPFTYAWDNGTTANWQAGLSAGTYTATVTDMNGCTSVDSAILTNPTQLVVTSSVDSNVSCNGLSNGGASLAVSGGTTPYTYAWDNGDVTSSITGLSAGVYNYTVTDINYCYVSGSVTITQPAQIAVTTQIDSLPNCFGDSDAGATAIATGGVGVFSYEWSSGQLTDVITGVSSGTYSVTATDASGCTGIGSVTIVDPAQINAVVNNLSGASCYGVADGEAEVTATGGTAPYSFEWSNGELSTQNTSLRGGEHFVTTTDVYGCEVIDTVQITQPDSIEFVFTITDVTCEDDTAGGSVLVTTTGGNGGESFQWANGTAGNQISNVSTGNYEVTVTDMNGCTNNDIATVGFTNPLPVVDLGSDTAYGAPSLITLTTGNNVDNHVWSTGATGSSLELDFVQDTTVWVTVTSAAGCVNSDTVNIDALLGVKGISKPFTVRLYPNPTHGDLNIEISENTADNITIQVVDFTGKLVSTKEWNSMGTVVRESLDLNELSQGTYFVNVILDGERYTERITVY